jgi:hypothetical protein
MNRLLIFSDYYLPGFKAGGPIRSISNLCDSLKDEYEVYVVTRDRDLGSNEVYKGYLNVEKYSLNKVVNQYLSCYGVIFNHAKK